MTERRPRARTWTLSALDRASTYVLWFEPRAQRWEVSAAPASPGVPIVTRAPAAARPPRRRASAEDGRPDDGTPA